MTKYRCLSCGTPLEEKGNYCWLCDQSGIDQGRFRRKKYLGFDDYW